MVGVVYLLSWVTGTSEVESQANAYRAQQKQRSGQGLSLGSGQGISLSASQKTLGPVKKPENSQDRLGLKSDVQSKTGLTVKTAVIRKSVLPAGILPVKKVQPVAAKPRFYIVKAGETLSDVAAAVYGEAHRQQWRRIHEANSYKVPNAHIVWPGLKLRIPSLGTSKPLAAPRKIALARSRTYTVMSGDTLSEISSKKLGTSKRWREILALNKGKLSSEYGLRVGMVLKLPAAAKPTDIRLPKSSADIWGQY